MKKLNVRAALAAATLLLLGASPQVSADNCCNTTCCDNSSCWNPCDCCGDFEIGAHALLFQPSSCRYDFAERAGAAPLTPGTAVSHGTIGTIDPGLHWGFRVWGDYIQDCMFVGVGYQWLEAKNSGRLAGDDLITLRDNPVGAVGAVSVLPADSASGRLFWRYQNVDVRIGGIKSSCNGEMYGFINARWIDLEHKRRLSSFGTTGTATVVETTQTGNDKAQFQGGALGLGFGGRRNLMCNFGVIGELNLLGVIGKRQTSADFTVDSKSTTAGVTTVTHVAYVPGYKSVTSVTPEIDFRVGLDYTWCCDCWTIIGEIGYEMDYFWDVFEVASELNPGLIRGNSWKTTCDDVGFSGLFFGLRALF